MNFVVLMFLSLTLIVGCTKGEVGKDKKASNPNQVEEFAKEDFEAMRVGKKPIHAVPDEEKPDLSDGGTTFYKGDGYTVVLKSTLAEQNGVNGYMYGPIVTFENIKVEGKPKEVSDVRFYSTEDLKKLRGY